MALWMDDIGVNIAKKEGLIDPLPADQIPNLAKVFPSYIVEGGYGVGIDVSPVALTYSTRDLQEAPTSWAALWDPRYKDRVAVPSIAGTHGVNLVVVAAALETGKPFQDAQYETDAAFKKLAELKPNLHSIFSRSALVVPAMQQGELIIVGPYYGPTSGLTSRGGYKPITSFLKKVHSPDCAVKLWCMAGPIQN